MFSRKKNQAPSSANAVKIDPRHGQAASLRRRLASMLYEVMLLVGVLSITLILPHMLIGMIWKVTVPNWVMQFNLFLVLGWYFVWYWRRHSQTLSMQTWRLKLVRAVDNGPPTLEQCMLRYVLCWPSVCLLGVGILWALFDSERQFLHDRLAGTRLIYFDHSLERRD